MGDSFLNRYRLCVFLKGCVLLLFLIASLKKYFVDFILLVESGVSCGLWDLCCITRVFYLGHRGSAVGVQGPQLLCCT